MEIKISSKQTLMILNIICWIIFVGLSIDACGIIVSAIRSLYFNPGVAAKFWGGVDLSDLLAKDRGYFMVITFIMSLVKMMQATMFYLIIHLLQNGKLNMEQPFSVAVGRVLFLLGYLSLAIGFFCSMGDKYAKWQVINGIAMPPSQDIHLGAADVWIFMGVTLFVVANIFKRGIEIQKENDLTI